MITLGFMFIFNLVGAIFGSGFVKIFWNTNKNEMTLEKLKTSLRLPVIASPLFILSNPRTVVAQCCAGVVGSSGTNARRGTLKQWLEEIKEKLEKNGKTTGL